MCRISSKYRLRKNTCHSDSLSSDVCLFQSVSLRVSLCLSMFTILLEQFSAFRHVQRERHPNCQRSTTPHLAHHHLPLPLVDSGVVLPFFTSMFFFLFLPLFVLVLFLAFPNVFTTVSPACFLFPVLSSFFQSFFSVCSVVHSCFPLFCLPCLPCFPLCSFFNRFPCIRFFLFS